MGGVAELEREQIGARTREALPARRAAGVRLGRPSVLTTEVVARIVSERQDGATLWGIANRPTADRIPTARTIPSGRRPAFARCGWARTRQL
jgi:DNA invertase Pin-like site-specific DNA recombinase